MPLIALLARARLMACHAYLNAEGPCTPYDALAAWHAHVYIARVSFENACMNQLYAGGLL